ncbi:MAG: hypothetical protein AMXMBFR53_02100 [Gemmatimonadota bacterium]
MAATGLLVVAQDQGALRGIWQGEMNGAPVEVVTLSVRRGSGWTMARADGARDVVTWSVLDDGRVRQHWTQGGSTVFDGYYRRR